MRKLLTVLLVLAATVCFSREASALGPSFGIDAALAIPVGDWADTAGTGIGALFYIDFALPAITITGRAGYIYGMPKEKKGADWNYSHIPVFGGVKWFPAAVGFYLAAELGLVYNSVEADLGLGNDVDDTDSDIGGTLGAGFQLGSFDLRGQLFFPELDDADDGFSLMATVGYRF